VTRKSTALIAATRSSDGNDQVAIQIASKSKSCGRQYQDYMINGDGTGNSFVGLINLVAAGQTLDAAATNGVEFSFDLLDELIDLVTDKDGAVDYLAVAGRTRRLYKQLLRAQPGAGLNETMELPSGKTVPTYGGIPLFRNDWIPTNADSGTTTGTSYVFAGTLDDGSPSARHRGSDRQQSGWYSGRRCRHHGVERQPQVACEVVRRSRQLLREGLGDGERRQVHDQLSLADRRLEVKTKLASTKQKCFGQYFDRRFVSQRHNSCRPVKSTWVATLLTTLIDATHPLRSYGRYGFIASGEKAPFR
jgi:hypothetical protein